jgi:hypothetical protein
MAVKGRQAQPSAELIEASDIKADKLEDDELDDLPPVTDERGAPVRAEDLLAEAERVDALEFWFAGRRYQAGLRKIDVRNRHSSRISNRTNDLLLEAGFQPGDEIDPTAEGFGDDPRVARFNELCATDAELSAAWAELATAATVWTNVPQLCGPQIRKTADAPKFAGARLLALGGLGDSYVEAVKSWWRPTTPPSEAAA